jgi:Fe-S cluster biogenesis protein NfuA
MNNDEFQGYTGKIDRLVQRASSLADEDARAMALELLQSVMDLHGAAMLRVVEILTDAGEAGRNSLAKLGSDPLICGLLVLYGVHPVPLEDRVARAVEQVRSKLQKQGGDLQLMGIDETAARISIQSSGTGCHSSPEALKEVAERAILEAAPELVEVIAEGTPSATSAFVPLETIQPANPEGKRYEESAA